MTAPTTPLANNLDAVVRFGNELGRKFEPDDVVANPWLKQVATRYALDTIDSLGFMADMAVAAGGRWGLSNAQAKGVLNVIMGRARSNTPALALPNLRDVPSARYRVSQPDGSSTAVRIDSAAWAADKPKGTRALGLRTGNTWLMLGFIELDGSVTLWQRGRPHLARLAPALTTVVDGVADGTWIVLALSYAQEASECAFCGSDLDTEASLTVGYGPTCAKKHGLPWGAKAEPMSVVLARQAARQTAPVKGAVVSPPSTPNVPVAPPVSTSDTPKQIRRRTYDEVFPEDATSSTSAAPSLLDLARQIEGGAA